MQDLAKTEQVVTSIRRYMAASRELEHSLKCSAALRSIDNFSANIYIVVHTTSAVTREFSACDRAWKPQ